MTIKKAYHFALYLLCLFIINNLTVRSQTIDEQPYTFPSNFRDADCLFENSIFDMSIVEKYRSQTNNVSTYFSAVIGDLDGDGYAEIVIPGGTTSNLNQVHIFDYKARLLKTIYLPENARMQSDYDSVVLADLDNDGKGEIIVTASNPNNPSYMFIFDYQGNLISSLSQNKVFSKTTGVADFNKDGFPEIYSGTQIYAFRNQILMPLNNFNPNTHTTIAQDIDGDGALELISPNTVYRVEIDNHSAENFYYLSETARCSNIGDVNPQTLALSDIDRDGDIDVITINPSLDPFALVVTVWNPRSGETKYQLNLPLATDISTSIRNSWPFVGDTNGDGYPDIIFMGGLASQGHTSIYRLAYNPDSAQLETKTSNNQFNDYSSMSTSMSMFDFNNDGKYEIVYRDETSLFVINGETLEVIEEIPNCLSGTGWEYPVVASLTPSGESYVIMASGEGSGWISTGTLRLYGADTENGAKPWIPARKVWNQFAFYQNLINDDLTIISNPAPLNVTLLSKDRQTSSQPFNGHMIQLGIISPSTLKTVFPISDVKIDRCEFGHNKLSDQLLVTMTLKNNGAAALDSGIVASIYKVKDNLSTSIYTKNIQNDLNINESISANLILENLSQHQPFDKLVIKVQEGKQDCDVANNDFSILSDELNGILYVKKGATGKGTSWTDAVGELSTALNRAKSFPYSVSQIWVAAGTYEGSFEMLEGVNVHGGFAGNETDFNKMDTLLNKTYIDARNQSRVLTQLEEFSIPTEWAGVILQNGLEYDRESDVYGGGAYLKHNGTLRYSTIRNNRAIASSYLTEVSARGGGVYLEEGAMLMNSIVDGNIAVVIDTCTNQPGQGNAHGGGVYNAGNKLRNLLIKNNKTESGLNADGGAAYSFGEITNCIIHSNKGKSVILVNGSHSLINNTVVDNQGESIVVGIGGKSQMQNSIIYNNTLTTAGDAIKDVIYQGNKNLIDIDPVFKADRSFMLDDTSPARAIGNPTCIPSDLNTDFYNNRRCNTISSTVRLIDAGACQTSIKVLSATQQPKEVPFGRSFDDLNLNNNITISLEFDVTCNVPVSWINNNYNPNASGETVIEGILGILPDGVINPNSIKANIPITILRNDDAVLENITLGNENWTDRLNEDYIVGCENTATTIPVRINLPYGATFEISPEVIYTSIENSISFDIHVNQIGKHTFSITVTSENEHNSNNYQITIDKRFPFWNIVEQKWNNTLVVNNNSTNNGGYTFNTFKWFKDGQEVGQKQYYSAGPKRTDLLDENASFYAKMTDSEGREYCTCAGNPLLTDYGIKITPNPVASGETISVTIPSLAKGQTGTIHIYSLTSSMVREANIQGEVTTIKAPDYSGIYILKISLSGGVSESQRIIVYQ